MSVFAGFVVPPLPHPLLVPDANPGYRRLADAYDEVRQQIEAIQPDLILLYSTRWTSIIGHQVQADPEPTFTYVDPEWHELGSIPYKFRMDPEFAAHYCDAGRARGLEMRTVNYEGFPIDVGTITALKLLNPDNAFPASVVSCNMYADRAETLVLGKAARDAVAGKRVVAIAVTSLSNRLHADIVPLEEDRIHSQKDDEWNRKYLEFLAAGRLEDASQLAREFSLQAGGDSKMKAIWWLAAFMGQSNGYDGTLHAYEAIYGTGAAIVGLVPTDKQAAEAEFDEDDAEVYQGDRNVLGGVNRFESAVEDASPPVAHRATSGIVQATAAPKPVGAYPHARHVGDMLYLSGLGSRNPEDNSVPGGPCWNDAGEAQEYDIKAQTEQVIANMKVVLASAGATIDDVVDVTCYLIDMERDFAGFNDVYAKHFGDVQATRTTLQIGRLPTPIAVEFKVVAKAPEVP